MIVGVAIIGAIGALAIPVLVKTVMVAKVRSVGYDCNALVRRAKADAIKKNSPVVIKHDASANLLTAFVDVHGATINDPPDFQFGPDATAMDFATDHEVAQCILPAGVYWGGPLADPDITLGFTVVGMEKLAVMEPDGSIQDIGAFRFHDQRGNYLSIQIAPAATARVTLLKWDPATSKWREQDEDGKIWNWD